MYFFNLIKWTFAKLNTSNQRHLNKNEKAAKRLGEKSL